MPFPFSHPRSPPLVLEGRPAPAASVSSRARASRPPGSAVRGLRSWRFQLEPAGGQEPRSPRKAASVSPSQGGGFAGEEHWRAHTCREGDLPFTSLFAGQAFFFLSFSFFWNIRDSTQEEILDTGSSSAQRRRPLPQATLGEPQTPGSHSLRTLWASPFHPKDRVTPVKVALCFSAAHLTHPFLGLLLPPTVRPE